MRRKSPMWSGVDRQRQARAETGCVAIAADLDGAPKGTLSNSAAAKGRVNLYGILSAVKPPMVGCRIELGFSPCSYMLRLSRKGATRCCLAPSISPKPVGAESGRRKRHRNASRFYGSTLESSQTFGMVVA